MLALWPLVPVVVIALAALLVAPVWTVVRRLRRGVWRLPATMWFALLIVLPVWALSLAYEVDSVDYRGDAATVTAPWLANVNQTLNHMTDDLVSGTRLLSASDEWWPGYPFCASLVASTVTRHVEWVVTVGPNWDNSSHIWVAHVQAWLHQTQPEYVAYHDLGENAFEVQTPEGGTLGMRLGPAGYPPASIWWLSPCVATTSPWVFWWVTGAMLGIALALATVFTVLYWTHR